VRLASALNTDLDWLREHTRYLQRATEWEWIASGSPLVREVASKTSDIAGDGTTTATVLAASIMKEGLKLVAACMNPMDLNRVIDIAVTAVVKYIQLRS